MNQSMSPQAMSPLEYLHSGLRHLEYTSLFFGIGEIEGFPVETIFLPLLKDQLTRDFELQIILLDEIFAAAAEHTDFIAVEPRAYSFQFILRCPYTVNPSQTQLLQAIALELNAHLDIGHIGVNVDDGIYYRYHLMQPSPKVNMATVLEVIESLKQSAHDNHPFFSSILDENNSAEEILKELKKARLKFEESAS